MQVPQALNYISGSQKNLYIVSVSFYFIIPPYSPPKLLQDFFLFYYFISKPNAKHKSGLKMVVAPPSPTPLPKLLPL